jgi:hypothetical protein
MNKIKKPYYYVDMPHNLIATQVEGPKNIITLVVDLEDPLIQKNKKQKTKNKKQSSLGLTLFGRVPSQIIATPFTCKTNERKVQSLVDYSMSHVFTFERVFEHYVIKNNGQGDNK